MTEVKLKDILARARKDVKRNTFVYEYYKQQIEELLLDSKDYEQAIRQLAEILKV